MDGQKTPLTYTLMCDICGQTGQMYVIIYGNWQTKPIEAMKYICCQTCREKVLDNWERYQ